MASRRRNVPIGWAGFDGGYRRALSFASNKRQQVEDDDPIFIAGRVCDPDALTIDIVLSTFTDCGCFLTIPPSLFLSAKVTGFTGITGAYTLNQDTPGVSAWSGLIGTIDIEFYLSDNLCITPDHTDTFNVQAQAVCGILGYSASVNIIGTADIFTGLFLSSPSSLGAAMPNTLTCDGQTAGLVDTVTLSL